MRRPAPESTTTTKAPPRRRSRLAALFERVAATTAVLVVSVAWVTDRYPPGVRTSALVCLWSGAVALAGVAWAATAATTAVHRRLRRGRRSRDPVLERVANFALRVFPPLAPWAPLAPAPAELEPADAGLGHSSDGAGERSEGGSGGRPATARSHVLRAVALLGMSMAVAWSGGVLGPTWQPLCAGLVEALAVAAIYRLSRVYRRRPAVGATDGADAVTARAPAVAVAGSPGVRS